MSQTSAAHETGSHPTAAHDAGAHVSHVVPIWLLGVNAGALLVLTLITVWVTRFDFGPRLNLVIAMVIALIKATLVVLFFMHLVWDKPMNSIVFVSSLTFVTLFVIFALFDSSRYSQNIQQWRAAEAAQGRPVIPAMQDRTLPSDAGAGAAEE